MTVNVEWNDKCPCGSGKRVKDCCLRRDGTLRPWPCVTRPPEPKTGMQRPGCYAAGLADCSDKLSKEHIVSAALLRLITRDGMVGISGLAWQPPDTMQLHSIAALGTRVLCQRHNSALAPLDTLAERFFSKLDLIYQEFIARVLEDRIFLFNGNDIERWMLKLLCGAVYSGNIGSSTGPLRGWTPPDEWLRMLYGQARFPPGAGLSVYAKPGATNVDGDSQPPEVQCSIVTHPQQGICGMVLMLKTIKFVLLMTSPSPNEYPLLAHTIYRPSGVRLAYIPLCSCRLCPWSHVRLRRGYKMVVATGTAHFTTGDGLFLK